MPLEGQGATGEGQRQRASRHDNDPHRLDRTIGKPAGQGANFGHGLIVGANR